ncbi:hypothetical protein H5410_050996 [Solanum commersonii]|uniref:Uncharacterized protein n=1 Tax=Solanum commersonii TaxID=4109 RepID=A0A9J5WWZ7_SOLCO|nr:hypothetical protein H5410_050996 [Solanum commersonii]
MRVEGEFDSVLLLLNYGVAFIWYMGIQSVVNEKAGRSAGLHNGTNPSLFLPDIVGVVLRCGPSKYAGRTQNRCREVTIPDDKRNQFLLTLWDDFEEIEGAELEAQMGKGKEFL